MRCLLLILGLALAGCNTPTPEFAGVVPVEVAVEGQAFRVFRSGDRAQAIRLTPDGAPNFRAEERVTHAIQVATGCAVVGELRGDVALTNARVDCGAGARPWPRDVVITLDCDLHGGRGLRQAFCVTH